MPEENVKKLLHIVPSVKRVQITPQDFIEHGSQGVLFPTPRHGLIIFMLFPDVTEEEFRETLKGAMASYVIDLRASPRFDIGNFNRQLAFQAFQYQNTTYLDLTSTLMGNLDQDALIYRVREFFRDQRPKLERPIIFLLTRIEFDEGLIPKVLETLATLGIVPSSIFEIPKFESNANSGWRLAAR